MISFANTEGTRAASNVSNYNIFLEGGTLPTCLPITLIDGNISELHSLSANLNLFLFSENSNNFNENEIYKIINEMTTILDIASKESFYPHLIIEISILQMGEIKKITCCVEE